MGTVSGDYKHYGLPEPGVWGAMTAPVGARRDWWVQKAREAAASVLNATTSWEWEAPPPQRMADRARVWGR